MAKVKNKSYSLIKKYFDESDSVKKQDYHSKIKRKLGNSDIAVNDAIEIVKIIKFSNNVHDLYSIFNKNNDQNPNPNLKTFEHKFYNLYGDIYQVRIEKHSSPYRVRLEKTKNGLKIIEVGNFHDD